MSGERRGQETAALDAAGAGLGSIGLMAFAAVFLLIVPRSVPAAFIAALLAWASVSVTAWWMRRKLRVAHRHHRASMRARADDRPGHLAS
jgi:divalent metal cation (Fe/Co/Zn/Cd) transporter